MRADWPRGGTTQSSRYRRILWVALALNAAMFVVELAGSQRADSLSLMADAIDFAGDALNYGVSLAELASAAAPACSAPQRG